MSMIPSFKMDSDGDRIASQNSINRKITSERKCGFIFIAVNLTVEEIKNPLCMLSFGVLNEFNC